MSKRAWEAIHDLGLHEGSVYSLAHELALSELKHIRGFRKTSPMQTYLL